MAAANGPTAEDYSNLTPDADGVANPGAPGRYHSPAAIVLLTDGENNENPDPLAAAQSAADRGVRIYTVGIGSPAGATIDLNGFRVHTQLEEATLQQISQVSGGSYYGAADAAGLHAIYDDLDTTLVIKPEDIELTAIFAGLALVSARCCLGFAGMAGPVAMSSDNGK